MCSSCPFFNCRSHICLAAQNCTHIHCTCPHMTFCLGFMAHNVHIMSVWTAMALFCGRCEKKKRHINFCYCVDQKAVEQVRCHGTCMYHAYPSKSGHMSAARWRQVLFWLWNLRVLRVSEQEILSAEFCGSLRYVRGISHMSGRCARA
jgi:hypothetical protein